MKFLNLAACLSVAVSFWGSSPALAAACGNTSAGFNTWLGNFERQAEGAGISRQVIAASLKGVSYNTQVVRLDRNQKHFSVSFESFVSKRVTPGRVSKGRSMLKRHAKLLASIERRYGVPPEIIVAIWAMETDFGVNRGKMNVFRSLATLAYDCRRSAFFTDELMAALTIVQRGWMSPSHMRGAWAGELGQTQFLASNYLKYAVDYNGDGRRDLVGSTADALASTANLLRAHGWRKGGGFNQSALTGWNKSRNYQRAIVYFAEQLDRG